MPDWKNSLATALTRPVLGVERLLRGRFDPRNAERVLVLQFATALGSMILETPVLEALRRGCPQRKIAVATHGLGLQVLRHSPFVDELIETPHPSRNLPGAVRSLRRQLRQRGFRPDCVLTAAFDGQRAVTRLGILAGRAWRGGFAEEPWMVDASLGFDPALSVLANNLRASALLGCDGGGLEPRVFYTQQDLDAARTILEPARRDGRPVLTVVAAGSSGIAWLEERFAEVIAYAARQLGFAIFCTGTAREAAAIDRLRGLAAVETAFVGPQSVPAQTALFALSDLALAVDTGPMHLARAAGVPMVVLAGCWERPHVWLPIGLAHIAILQGPFRSRPGADYLMDDLSAAEVQGALAEMARRYPPDQAARSARAAAGLSNIDLRAR